jgi:hypothetical protein
MAQQAYIVGPAFVTSGHSRQPVLGVTDQTVTPSLDNVGYARALGAKIPLVTLKTRLGRKTLVVGRS